MSIPMAENVEQRSRVAVFGEARWDWSARRLIVRGVPAALPWRVAEALAALLEGGGTVVTKEDLQRRIWGGALIDESNLAHCVKALRKVLDPAPDGSSYVETVARVGYRLAVPVSGEFDPPPAPTPPPRGRQRLWRVAAAFALVGLAAAGAYPIYIQWERRRNVDDLIRTGRDLVRRDGNAETSRGVEMIRQANRLIPDYPPALAAMGELIARRGNLNWDDSVTLVRRSLELDPNCALCQAIAGYVFMSRGWKWEEAGRHLDRAVALDGEDSVRRIWYAEWLSTQNRLADARRQAETAARLAPADGFPLAMLAGVHYLSGNYRESIRTAGRALALDEHLQPAHYWMYRSYAALGDDGEAAGARAKFATAKLPNPEEEFLKLQQIIHKLLRTGGRSALVRAWMDELSHERARETHRYERAVWSMWIGQPAGALAELEAAVISKPYHMIFVAADPVFAPLRGEPRFQEVVRRVGLQPPR